MENRFKAPSWQSHCFLAEWASLILSWILDFFFFSLRLFVSQFQCQSRFWWRVKVQRRFFSNSSSSFYSLMYILDLELRSSWYGGLFITSSPTQGATCGHTEVLNIGTGGQFNWVSDGGRENHLNSELETVANCNPFLSLRQDIGIPFKINKI